MNATEQAYDVLAAQECESLAACVARGQETHTYADVVEKLRGHMEKLPLPRKIFWGEQLALLGVAPLGGKVKAAAPSIVGESGPEITQPKKVDKKLGGTSVP